MSTLWLVLLPLVALIVIIGGYMVVLRRVQALPEAWATSGTTRIRVELAVSAMARMRGLSYRDALPEGRGMWFVFGNAQRHAFWMQGMRFPIDIIWLRDGVIVDISAEVPPPRGAVDALQTYRPTVPANEVLEVPAGFAARSQMTVGDRVVITTE